MATVNSSGPMTPFSRSLPLPLFLGVDPGLSGALALLSKDGELVLVEDMPTAVRGHGRVKHEVDAHAMAHLLRPYSGQIVHGVLERVGARPGQGVASMFSLGHSLGVVTGVLTTMGLGYELLTPAKWKQAVEVPADKGLTLAAARRRWPLAKLTRAKDHGRAEAMFLALVASRRHMHPSTG